MGSKTNLGNDGLTLEGLGQRNAYGVSMLFIERLAMGNRSDEGALD